MSIKIEDKYIKLTHREHVLHRSDMYIGTTNIDKKEVFVVEDVNDFKNLKIIKKEIDYNPGFIKIFDEILTNASDHSIRTNEVKYIKINIYEDHISIENDGPGIPVRIHEKEKIYIPELLFGNLLTSENYDDSKERLTGGRNGIGATLTNIYSKIFEVETADGKKYYYQKFTNNLERIFKPKIKCMKKNYTKITFYPDFDKFNMNKIDNDIESILLKRVIDIASYNPNVKIYYNDNIIPIKNYKDYMKMFINENDFIYEKIDNNWEFGISLNDDEIFTNNSMVNGISTLNGGTHVNFISNLLSNSIRDHIIKSNKGLRIKPMDIKNNIFLFMSCKIVNPTFENQTKETLTSKITSNIKLSELFIKKLNKSHIVEEITNRILFKNKSQLQKDLNKKNKNVKIKKLDDAINAGTFNSKKCKIFLTEGDCLHENSNITIIRKGEKIEIKIKDIKLNDAVITHNNNIGYVNNISKKIEKSVKIKLKNNNILICSKNHQWYVYDKIDNEFIFKKTKDLNINRHRMIINKNVNFENLIKIKNIIDYKTDKFDKIIYIEDNEEILSSNDHKFSIFDIKEQKFNMIECKNLNKKIHYIVNYNKI
jgi:DNA topoisomerase-2